MLLQAYHSPNSSGLQRLEAAALLKALDAAEKLERIPEPEPEWASAPHGEGWGPYHERGH